MPIQHIEAGPKTLYESVGFSKPGRIMDTYVITMGPELPPKPMVHPGQDFMYTLEGIHEFYYDGSTYTLNQGDAVYFDSDRPHMGRSVGRRPAKVLVGYCNVSAQL
jgi:mannose-6-phosphate isomerase-like protein (cupin superfamily)